MENRMSLIPSIRTTVRILPTCHDYVDGCLDSIEVQSDGLKAEVSGAEVMR